MSTYTHEHIHNKSAEPSEMLFMSDQKIRTNKLELQVFPISVFFFVVPSEIFVGNIRNRADKTIAIVEDMKTGNKFTHNEYENIK